MPCLESVQAQGDVLAKHLLMDGCSRDGTIDVLRGYQQVAPKLFWISEADRGQANALNKALAQVDTEYFGWLNADDCYVENGLSRLADARLRLGSEAPVIIYGDYQVINEKGEILRHRRQPSFNYFDCVYGYLTVQNGAALFHTETVRAAGGFDEMMSFAMDYDLVAKVANRGSVYHVREYIGQFRLHGLAKTATLQEVCMAETAVIRSRYGIKPAAMQRIWMLIAKFRVGLRMAREGCLGCRLGFARH
jgi:glycosyltransferase involved in cell wall biosynthesis